MSEMALCRAISYYWDCLDNPHTQTEESWSENETVREAWRSYMRSSVTKVFWSAVSGTYGCLKVLPLVTRGVEVS